MDCIYQPRIRRTLAMASLIATLCAIIALLYLSRSATLNIDFSPLGAAFHSEVRIYISIAWLSFGGLLGKSFMQEEANLRDPTNHSFAASIAGSILSLFLWASFFYSCYSADVNIFLRGNHAVGVNVIIAITAFFLPVVDVYNIFYALRISWVLASAHGREF